jgi:hypothetical protein
MRGFPLLNFLLCLGLGLGVVAPLVWRATGTGAPVVMAVHKEVAAGRVEASVRVRCVHGPRMVSLRDGGVVLREWSGGGDEREFEERLAVPMDGGRVEFQVVVEWPEGTPDTVAEVTIEPDGLAAQTVNVWGTGGRAEEIVSVSWVKGVVE